VGRRLGWAWILIPVVLVSAGWVNGGKLGGVWGSVPDGDAPNTFYTSTIMDGPGAAMFVVHCHGRMSFDVQLGETTPARNPCYGVGPPLHGSQIYLDFVTVTPWGGFLNRYSVNRGPWKYYLSDHYLGWPTDAPGWPHNPMPN
jgi:hypothetical protein